ncbi:MAG TPA: hypothetical protein VFS40_08350 [Gemmatimonadales bacterium]|nr:hypothetical protein [Gemmatimonadales bacterium]
MTAVEVPAAATHQSPPQRSLLSRAALYGGARSVSQGLLAVRGVVLAMLLGPTAFGAWALVRLVTRHAVFANLGILRGLEYELVPRDSAGSDAAGSDAAGSEAGATADAAAADAAAAHTLAARTALGYLLVVFGGLALAGFGLAFAVDDPMRRLELRAVAGAVLADQLYMYGLVCLRIRGDLRHYARVELIHAAMQVVTVLLLAWRWGLGGALTGLILATFAAALFAAPHAALRPAFDRGAFRRLCGIGIPVALAQLLSVAASSVDRWAIAALGGTTLLGYYSFAAAIAGVGGTGAWVLRTVVIRDLYGRARRLGASFALRAHLQDVVRPYAFLYPALLGAAAFAIGPAVALVVPRYLPAVEPARLFVFAGAASGLVQLTSVGAVAAQRQRRLPQLFAVALLVSGATSVLALQARLGLGAVALGALLGQLVVAAGLLGLLAHGAGYRAPVARSARLLAPFAWCVVLVLALGHVFAARDLRAGALGLALYALALLPLGRGFRRQFARIS